MSFFNYAVSKTIMHVPSPVVHHFAKDYVAGNDLDDAVRVCRELSAKGIESTLDILGEYITKKEQALPFKQDCIDILETIHRDKLDANLSVKPSQMGLLMDYDFAFNNLRDIVARAAELNGFVRIDMEDIECNEDTIKIYRILREEFPDHVGTALQSYMRNAMDHLELLGDGPINLRLVKGIFIVTRQQAWRDPELITRNYIQLLERMFELGAYVGIATHDERLYYEAQKLIKKFGLKREQYEFQMLLGVDPELRDLIVSEGHRLRVYIPYGKQWLGYSRRRLLENPNIARAALGQMLRGTGGR
ncbi:L-proline dehydrogenase [Desulfocicer vacuolatum DSM 3385]|uniref:proline dehydrogenase n=1 Tax=Desulfocicer vacuolatum DSM 3385 TaxID=1121400 RepID=A0A1W2CKH1_9BACT|nr:proline dehydrogenase family protein [Desulfocicer vacuolatum]SMC85690.1 L-proline dehydrogenase [Desulfocicer vacuolatum DSM 3385]